MRLLGQKLVPLLGVETDGSGSGSGSSSGRGSHSISPLSIGGDKFHYIPVLSTSLEKVETVHAHIIYAMFQFC